MTTYQSEADCNQLNDVNVSNGKKASNQRVSNGGDSRDNDANFNRDSQNDAQCRSCKEG